MQNKGKCGCEQGFVPVIGNWDFNMDRSCGCQQDNGRRNRRSACQTEREYAREREENDCQCERCDDDREAECCERNTYLRDMEDDRPWTDCPCQTRSRARRCEECDECCERCECNECRENRENRACSECRERRHGCDRRNSDVGMVSVEMQEIDEIFQSESALRAGTLFPELHMPLNGYCPCDSNCGTCKQAAAFAAWEMRLYLNTHPHDREALALFRKLCKEAGEENYATTFLTDECCTTAWNWVKNPWPWEYSCQCGDREQDCPCRNGRN
ncbi:MAG: spore coat protein CotJB [Aristaeellaceae bacterium]